MKDAPPGFTLSGNSVPANEDQVRLTLTAPPMVTNEPFNLALEGFARIGEQPVIHPAIPAENRMQAFAYWHLVPSKELEVTLVNRGQTRVALTILDPACVNIPAGGTAAVRVRIPGPAFTNNFQLEVDAPPDGISIENVSATGMPKRRSRCAATPPKSNRARKATSLSTSLTGGPGNPTAPAPPRVETRSPPSSALSPPSPLPLPPLSCHPSDLSSLDPDLSMKRLVE